MSPGRKRDGWSGGFPPAAKPRPVAGGLVARSARGAIGDQWWSQRFLAVRESFALGSRLSRGKNYARRGQVVSLEVGPGRVLAVVQGSRRNPYRVSIGLAAFSELVWAKTEVALAEQAGLSAGCWPVSCPRTWRKSARPRVHRCFLSGSATSR